MSITRAAAAMLSAAVVLFSAAPAQARAFPDLVGHWRCSGADVERSYVAEGSNMYGRGDDAKGAGDIERIAFFSGNGTLSAELPEGNGVGTIDESGAVVVAGRDSAGAPFSVTTAVHNDVLTRDVTGAAGNSSERCTRERAPIAQACAAPNRPAGTLYAPRPAFVSMNAADVYVEVVLDDRSEIMWTQVVKHSDDAEDASAVQATRESRFQTAVRNCLPQAGAYIFVVSFRRR